MPTDQTTKALSLCTRLSVAADQIMSGLEEIMAVKDQKESSGIDFNTEDLAATLAGSSLKHADGNNFNSVLTSGVALKTFLETGYHDDILQSVRSGS